MPPSAIAPLASHVSARLSRWEQSRARRRVEDRGWKLIALSSISGVIGSGSEIVTTTLPAGAHTITLTATNSAGLTASQTLTLTVK